MQGSKPWAHAEQGIISCLFAQLEHKGKDTYNKLSVSYKSRHTLAIAGFMKEML